MTREEAKKAAEVMLAYAEGKEIECYKKASGEWVSCHIPFFNWEGDVEYGYRIKPEPAYRPFANSEECWQEMQKHQPFGWVKDKDNGDFLLIDCVSNERIVLARKGVVSFDKVDERVTFPDGSTFGIKTEE